METRIRTYEDLEVWKLSHHLVLDIYKLSEQFPKEENFIIKSQILRAAISIPANIAEGIGRSTRKEYIHFLVISRGSLNEVNYFLLLIKDLGYLPLERYLTLKEDITHITMMLNKLITRLRETSLQYHFPNPPVSNPHSPFPKQ